MTLSINKGSIPLYMQIEELLITKISNKIWLPGNIIPSEIKLAKDLEVSQGTVRKAITELVNKNVLIRKQGKGTFVASHDIQRALFHFFHIIDHSGNKLIPQSQVLSCGRKKASQLESTKLKLKKDESVIRIKRIRKLNEKVVMLETIVLQEKLFSALDEIPNCNLPNMLYELYENQFGVTVYNAEEKLRAIAAKEKDAALLKIAPGTPLLEIERLALTLDGKPIELRISLCNTKNHLYENTIF